MKRYELVLTSRFKKDLKQCIKRKYDMSKIDCVIEMLISDKELPEKYRDHNLTGDWKAYHECHIEPDWLLLYRLDDDLLILTLTRTGTHSDLFG